MVQKVADVQKAMICKRDPQPAKEGLRKKEPVSFQDVLVNVIKTQCV